MTTANTVRLDKWLWAARFYKTRAIARQMIQSGKVHYNGQRTKPSKLVELGAMLRLRQGFDSKEVEVLQLNDQRRGAPEAQLMYRETEASITKREENAQARKLNAMYNPHPQGRPDKKQRRQLIQMKDSQRKDDGAQ
ncbi:heat shock protein Hsp15 [Idiomarina aquatica]|uniref:Heat shock protein 15 n=1 Tax=Idiomarina aquatica TaxID=1327752 RepID=A0A4R6PQR0_9GAMM|nr:ribosome-associated heat shock protein Hsp15 [Idiomarina aquatica]TDP40161.1 heat shock protein Hsp15 [Idiomarina aquatica]